MQGGKKRTPSKRPRKTPRPKCGGALSTDLQALAVPFALAVLQRGVSNQVKKTHHRGGGEDGDTMDGGGTRRRKHSKAKVAEIKREFMSITDAISNFLEKILESSISLARASFLGHWVAFV